MCVLLADNVLRLNLGQHLATMVFSALVWSPVANAMCVLLIVSSYRRALIGWITRREQQTPVIVCQAQPL